MESPSGEEEYEVSYLMNMPEELLVGTEENPGPLVELAFPDILGLRRVSSKFKHLIDNDDYFWKLKTQRDFGAEDRKTKSWKADYFRYSGKLTPKLTEAVIDGNKDLVGRLLDLGADPDSQVPIWGWGRRGRRGRRWRLSTPIRNNLIRATVENHLEIVELLLDAGAEVDAQDVRGNTALIWASNKGYLPIVKLLLASGANVNKPNSSGYTALNYAVEKGYSEIEFALRDAGAHKLRAPFVFEG